MRETSYWQPKPPKIKAPDLQLIEEETVVMEKDEEPKVQPQAATSTFLTANKDEESQETG